MNLETGLRADYIPDYGAAILPRVSAHFKITDKFSSRLGGGFGYKSPTIFTEDSERLQYQNVLPIDKDNNKLERSYGLNLDFNYVTSIFDGNVTFSINQLFFYTYLDNPLLLQSTKDGLYRLNNISGNTDSKGGETNVKIGYKDFHLYLGYTYTDTRTKENGVKQENILTPKRFPVWFSIFNGNTAIHLSTGKSAAICGNFLKDEELLGIGREQLYWTVGKNPFGQSLIYGEGYNYPQMNSFSSGEMTGEMPVGIRTLGNDDIPYWPQTGRILRKNR